MSLADLVAEYLELIPSYSIEQGEVLYRNHKEQFRYSIDEEGDYQFVVPSGKKKTLEVAAEIYEDQVDFFCSCSEFERNDYCIHTSSASRYLLQIIHEDVNDVAKDDKSPDESFSFTMNTFRPGSIRIFNNNFYDSWNLKAMKNVVPVDIETPLQKFQYKLSKKKIFNIEIFYDGKSTYQTKCDCEDVRNQMCDHVVSCFFYLSYTYNDRYFNRFKDYRAEKNQILEKYGLTVDDPESKDFIFEQDMWSDKINLKKKPDYIIAIDESAFYSEFKNRILGKEGWDTNMIRPKLPVTTMVDYEVGIIFNIKDRAAGVISLEAAYIREKKAGLDLKKLNLNDRSNWAFLQNLQDDAFNTIIEFSEPKLLDWLRKNWSGTYLASAYSLNHLDELGRSKIADRKSELLKKLWPWLSEYPYIFIHETGNFSAKNVKTIKVSKGKVNLGISVESDAKFITVRCRPEVKDSALANFRLNGKVLLESDNTLYLPDATDLPILEKFSEGYLKFPASESSKIIKQVISPLRLKYNVDMTKFSQVEFVEPDVQPRVLLSELSNQYLMLTPQFLYNNSEIINYDQELEFIEEEDGKTVVYKRNKEVEVKIYKYLQTLHPKFANQRNNQYYYLPFEEVMKNHWFLNAIQQIQNEGIPVYGLQELKKFKYNTNKPKFEIKTSSGIDWFDLKMEISWGDQTISFKELRKAILNSQEAVLLGDGTLGLIPETWLKQYSPLMKMGTEKDGVLKVSKLHYALLEDIYDKLDDAEIVKEIADKKKRLLDYHQLPSTPPSPTIKASLRPYQLSGFQWMQALDMLNWGGCLADDMGLGKTLQTITFLKYLQDKYPGNTHLVVCPTSLIFNWEAELNKFCPELKYHTYYGTQRNIDDEHFEKFDFVITTYGMIRSDFELLQNFQWHYIILDESHAIKNPDALITKALQKLNGKNRMILSGTPVQNNTFDLYAQFTFLNPGFLGSKEFFKNEFSIPIDKQSSKEKVEQLRKLIYPFMLRRTKSQVATDLPDKTEMILWCSMEKEQRAVYDKYKEYYKALLLEKIEDEGIEKSAIYVLEGLLRLRQICDHPALLKNDKIKTTESVKVLELLREIKENSGNNKYLVFSQFKEMLEILRQEFTNENISFCYLDGSTPTDQRQKQVAAFQEDESIRVFLISLKAGGVGLNLTAADYVYLVDPWWNPAAEQQAIDRTHRIGQTKKIFAYKMICKDSVEEKILQLQDKKKLLAGDLISEDAGFIKKLTKGDIEFLFG